MKHETEKKRKKEKSEKSEKIKQNRKHECKKNEEKTFVL